jgi:hypothetical protein
MTMPPLPNLPEQPASATGIDADKFPPRADGAVEFTAGRGK